MQVQGQAGAWSPARNTHAAVPRVQPPPVAASLAIGLSSLRSQSDMVTSRFPTWLVGCVCSLFACDRSSTASSWQVEPKPKNPWRDGTTHLVMSPLEFILGPFLGRSMGVPSSDTPAKRHCFSLTGLKSC
jgi:hypothetical protein